MRRLSSTLTRSAASGSPAGIPSRIATRPRPCDSPAVVKRNVTLGQPPLTSPTSPNPPLASPSLPIIAREPDSRPGSRCYRARTNTRPTLMPPRHRRPHGGCLRVRVRDGRERDHDEPFGRDPEQILLAGGGVERHAQG